ncbi:MAG: regulatory protein RecX [Flavobacteriales bacterium]
MPTEGNTQRFILEMERFCAYQERSAFEIKTKLHRKGATEEQVAFVIKYLISNNFLNEARFVAAFVQGKSRIKQWGTQRIKAGLRAHYIAEPLINEALSSLSSLDVQANLQRWLQKKQNGLKAEDDGPKKRAKIIRFLLSKGFNLDEILKVV